MPGLQHAADQVAMSLGMGAEDEERRGHPRLASRSRIKGVAVSFGPSSNVRTTMPNSNYSSFVCLMGVNRVGTDPASLRRMA
jgi:hypothetical protein